MKKTAILIVMLCLLLAFSACGVTTDTTPSSDSSADSSSIVEPKPYTITYECNGGSEIEPANYGADEMPIKPEDPVLEGFNFLGWFLDAEFTNEFNFDYPLNQDTTLYAYFSDVIFISTAEQLIAIRDNVDAKYLLKADIILKGATWEPIETFNGELDGNGHKISYFLMSTESALSGFIKTNNGTIKNLIIDEVAYSHAYSNATQAGVFAGVNNGSIINCKLTKSTFAYKSKASIYNTGTSSYIGLIAGQNGKTGVIRDCSISQENNVDAYNYAINSYTGWGAGTSTHHLYVGGICGVNDGIVSNCISENDLSVETAAGTGGATFTNYGGIAGISNTGAIIENCSTKCEFSNFSNTSDKYRILRISGICAMNYGEISKCYSNIMISIDQAITYTEMALAGIAVGHYGGLINSYASVDFNILSPSATYAGGFVTDNYGTIASCYATGKMVSSSATGFLGGFVGRNSENGAINGCFSSVEMHSATSNNFGAFVGVVDSGASNLKCFYSSATQMYVGEEVYEYVESVAGIAVAQAEEIFTADFIFGNLYWDEEIWQIDGENYPTLK